MTLQQRRMVLLQHFQSALDAVSGEKAVSRYLTQHPISSRCSLIAIGKASASMAMGAQQMLGEKLREGLVITKHGYGDHRLNTERVRQIESAHPVPDETSLAAGDALLEFLESLPDNEPLLFLLSGGTSSLVEVLPDTMSALQLTELNQWLLSSGVSISEMNAIRKRISCIKGGKLIPHLKGRPCIQLLISDVPGDEPGVIGSGPLIPDEQEVQFPEQLPKWLIPLLNEQASKQTSAHNINTHIIASNDLARNAVVSKARQLGVACTNHPEPFQGKVENLAEAFCESLSSVDAGLYVWGGESSVVLPDNPGRGGRNQHLALLLAQKIAKQQNLLVLVAGTDGCDGPTEDTGAMIDGETLSRGELEGYDVSHALRSADAGTFLEASGDLIATGPTASNVMDLVIAWKW